MSQPKKVRDVRSSGADVFNFINKNGNQVPMVALTPANTNYCADSTEKDFRYMGMLTDYICKELSSAFFISNLKGF